MPTCASKASRTLPAGRYVIELKGFAVGKKHVDYRRKIEMVTP